MRKVESLFQRFSNQKAELLVAVLRWRDYGERSARWFHQRLCQRHDQQSIQQLQRLDRTLASDPSGLAESAYQFYQELYSIQPVNSNAQEMHLQVVSPNVGFTDAARDVLLQP